MTWRLLHSPPLDGPENMALDEALMERARHTREPVFRVYTWSRPTLSIGRNQRAAGIYRDDVLAARGIGVVRRPTGGRALLHHREVTYSVTAPLAADESLLAAFARINVLLINAMQRLGVPTNIARPAVRAPAPGAAPCFAEPTAGELIFQGRKLVGSAQWRHRGALLQHGSILLEDDQSLIAGLMREPATPAPRPATLRDAMGRTPVRQEIVDALFAAVRALADSEATTLVPGRALGAETASRAERYRDPAWTWHR